MTKKAETGRRGEVVALAWLEQRGFRLLARNWRSGHKELDLVMESDRAIHIIEVKTLTAPLVMPPSEKVNAAKQGRLIAAARRFIAEYHIDREVQFDILSVILDGNQASVEYLPEAFYPIIRHGRHGTTG